MGPLPGTQALKGLTRVPAGKLQNRNDSHSSVQAAKAGRLEKGHFGRDTVQTEALLNTKTVTVKQALNAEYLENTTKSQEKVPQLETQG